jgi:glycosyltransferase involved in cell wall biosynthesis
MKVAIVHDYLNQSGGAERVVGALHQMFPRAPIYTTILDRSSLWPELRDADIRTSWMQYLPGLKRHFKKYLPLFPVAIESLDLHDYDLVISSSSAFAKGAKVRQGARHICYCHSPMRFAWDYERYVEREGFGPAVRLALRPVIRALRRWDVRTADRPHVFVANSSIVGERIRRCYGRSSEVVFPPVEIGRFTTSSDLGDYYLVVSRLNPYKRIDLAVRAFTEAARPLVVVGDGPYRAALEAMAGPTIRFLGRVPDEHIAGYYARCRGLIFPGEEDLGITPLEANASGRPVVAYRAGGALDTVIDGKTGVYFKEQTVGSLHDAVSRCEAVTWFPDDLRRHAERFSVTAFRTRFESIVERELNNVRPPPTTRVRAVMARPGVARRDR